MKKTLFFFFAFLGATLAQTSQPAIIHGTLRVLGNQASIGTDSIKNQIGLDIASSGLTKSKTTDTSQIGIMVEPTWNANAKVGAAGVRIWPRTANSSGHIPYAHMMDIYPPIFGTSSGAARAYGIYANSITGGDSANYAWYSNLGLFSVGDTSTFRRMVQFNAAVQYHGRVITTSGRVTDSDYVVLADIGGGRVVDTLPTLLSSVGRMYIFIQYSTTAGGNFTLKPSGADKIETYDSLNMRSNIGISKIILLNTSTKWSILYEYEEGTFAATLNGVSGTVTDTARYTRENLNVSFTLKPLVGTSNATTFTITGPDTRILNSGSVDTTYTTQQSAVAWNNSLKVEAACVMEQTSGIITCENVSTGFAAWTNVGTKGLRYGMSLNYKLRTQPAY